MSKTQKKAVIIIGPGFDDEEVIYSTIRLTEEGMAISLASPDAKLVKSHNGFNLEVLSRHFSKLIDAKTLKDEYDVVILAGGIEGPDKVRQLPEVLTFVKTAHAAGRIIAAVCHGPWILVSAGLLKGKNATCNEGMVVDLKNSGANYIDEPVVIDGNIITARHPRDLGAFMKAIIKHVG